MATERKPYKGDKGTHLDVNIQESNSGATDIKYYVLLPDGTEEVWAAAKQDTQKFRYTFVEILQSGIYKVTAWANMGDGWSGYFNTVDFKVYDKYK